MDVLAFDFTSGRSQVITSASRAKEPLVSQLLHSEQAPKHCIIISTIFLAPFPILPPRVNLTRKKYQSTLRLCDRVTIISRICVNHREWNDENEETFQLHRVTRTSGCIVPREKIYENTSGIRHASREYGVSINAAM